MFIFMSKIHFITHFFLEILHFKESWNLIGWQHFGPWLKNQNFARYGIGSEISTTILISILDYFQEKLTTKFSKKPPKTLFWGHFGPFMPKFGQKWFFLEKRTLPVFRSSNDLKSSQKSEKTIERQTSVIL